MPQSRFAGTVGASEGWFYACVSAQEACPNRLISSFCCRSGSHMGSAPVPVGGPLGLRRQRLSVSSFSTHADAGQPGAALAPPGQTMPSLRRPRTTYGVGVLTPWSHGRRDQGLPGAAHYRRLCPGSGESSGAGCDGQLYPRWGEAWLLRSIDNALRRGFEPAGWASEPRVAKGVGGRRGTADLSQQG